MCAARSSERGQGPPGNTVTGRTPAVSPSRMRISICGVISVPSGRRTLGRPIADNRIGSVALARSSDASGSDSPWAA